MQERFWLDWVPYCVRSWPWIRRYYWQQEDIDRAKIEAEELKQIFGEYNDKNKTE